MTVLGVILLKIFATCIWTLIWPLMGFARVRAVSDFSDWTDKGSENIKKIKTVFVVIPALIILGSIIVLPYVIIWGGF